MTVNYKVMPGGEAPAGNFSKNLKEAKGVISENRPTLPPLAGFGSLVVGVDRWAAGHAEGLW